MCSAWVLRVRQPLVQQLARLLTGSFTAPNVWLRGLKWAGRSDSFAVVADGIMHEQCTSVHNTISVLGVRTQSE